jgi:hypothetical protein
VIKFEQGNKRKPRRRKNRIAKRSTNANDEIFLTDVYSKEKTA